jgi:putative two-component system response regulator
MARVLVVDDNEMNRDVLERQLRRQGYAVGTANDGLQALAFLRCNDTDLVLLDIQMPVMDGREFLARLSQDRGLRDIPVIVISAQNEVDSVVQCIELGAEDYLCKPFNSVILRARISASLEKKRLTDESKRHRAAIEEQNRALEARVQSQVCEITAAHRGAIFAMSKLAESKDPETGAHLERMREYCRLLATRLAVTQESQEVDDVFVENIYAASPLHDIGKVGVADRILLKPGKLTAEEWVDMKTHTLIGANTLRAVHLQHPDNGFLLMGIEIAEGHHERWDGTGYPRALRGEAIPLSARILALGDVYDALTSRRCYKDAFSHEQSRAIILDGSGTHFDPRVVDAFLEKESEFLRVRREFQDDGE